MATEVAVLRHSELHASGIKYGVECAVYYSLRTDIHPAAGSHLSVVGYAHLHCFVPIVEVVKHTYHHGVGDDDARSLRTRGEKAEGVTRFHYEGLVFSQVFEIFLYESVLEPVLAYLPGLAVSDKFVGI